MVVDLAASNALSAGSALLSKAVILEELSRKDEIVAQPLCPKRNTIE
jgi:hypothetical protein